MPENIKDKISKIKNANQNSKMNFQKRSGLHSYGINPSGGNFPTSRDFQPDGHIIYQK